MGNAGRPRLLVQARSAYPNFANATSDLFAFDNVGERSRVLAQLKVRRVAPTRASRGLSALIPAPRAVLLTLVVGRDSCGSGERQVEATPALVVRQQPLLGREVAGDRSSTQLSSWCGTAYALTPREAFKPQPFSLVVTIADFPCKPGLFDVVIIDEASQCDLPSMTPVLYRATQAIIAGDSKQMQAQRFAFTATQVAAQAWREHGLEKLDPDGNFDPGKVSLLELASVRGSEEAFLDEHFRSLPGIISFSNDRWYRSKMRLMRDPDDRRVGDPDAPVCRLHHVKGALVTPNTQENPVEAQSVVTQLRSLMANPGYSDASFGVVCLFEQQVGLIQDLVPEQIDEDLRESHDLVVVNPDGFQGDERDVLLYSLSYDATNMEQAALSARQADRPHIQGMLNVAFTRAREEMHVFHSAPIEQYSRSK